MSAYGTDSAAVISWAMPAAQPVTNYLVQYSLNNTQWSSANLISTGRAGLSYVLGGLSNGQAHHIRVAAARAALTRAFTQMVGTVTLVAVPDPP